MAETKKSAAGKTTAAKTTKTTTAKTVKAKAEKTEESKIKAAPVIKTEAKSKTAVSNKPITKTTDEKTVMAKRAVKKTAMPEIKITKKKSVLFVASECYPFIATGGLADVMGALPKALAKNDNYDVGVIMPLYSSISGEYRRKLEYVKNFRVQLAWRNLYCGVFKYEENGVKYYFIDNEYYFKRSGNIYGFYDDGERFAFFSKAVLDAIGALDIFPDVLHCNDWQTAATVIYLRTLYNWSVDFRQIKTVFTVHNIEYQGKYGTETMGDLFGFPSDIGATIQHDNCINLMKGAIELSNAVNTVSATYAEEIKDPVYAHGLDPIIRRNAHKVFGILNGIDTDVYNPATDACLFKNYSAADMSGKAECKSELQKMLGLPVRENVPVMAIISRLVAHKGMDLIKGIADSLLGQDIQLVVLGKGDASYENYFTGLARNYQGKCSTIIAFNPDLSRKIYSGADIFLMPSKTEPCGLSQMIAARYGTVSVVRETGGLNDSIKPYVGVSGNGFTFRNYNSHDMLYVVNQAIRTYYDKAAWNDVRARAMNSDFGWAGSAAAYEALYGKLN